MIRTFTGIVLCIAVLPSSAAQRDIVVPTNTAIRIMAANLNGDSQTIEPFAIRIFQGLKPDVIAIQEFRYGGNTASEFRQFVDTAFGTNFNYFRESGAGYNIPNGVISRFPIRNAGTWDDALIPDRGFAWAQLDVPGDNDLYVVSVHLKASSGDASTRASEAVALRQLVTNNFPANAWIVMAGDMNLQSRSEAALTTFKTFLSDEPVPTDSEVSGDPDTNEPRSRPYDLVLPSFTFRTNFVPLVIGPRSFPNGLVFDSRVYGNLSTVAPIQTNDSGNGQHMAVLKDFRVMHSATNRVSVPEPMITFASSNALQWQSVSGVTYALEMSEDLVSWTTNRLITAASSNVVTTNVMVTNASAFFRVSF
jgi:endonuclease/exonuclease/phosphatase family metal-dependent hydrolase